MFRYNPEVSFGNILTSLSIVIGLGTFAYAEAQKRVLAQEAFQAEQRDLVGRGQGAAVRLDNELKAFFLSAEPLFVTTSEIAVNTETDILQRGVKARDYLWREITVLRADMEQRILSEENLPGGLAAIGEEAHEAYIRFLSEHADLRTAAYATLQEETQQAIFDLLPTATQTAQIGQALRAAHSRVQAEWLERSGELRAALLEELVLPSKG